MSTIINTIWVETELIKRGLVPPECRVLEITITPGSPLVIRYEVFVKNEQLDAFADALKSAAAEHAAAEERRRRALGDIGPR